MADPRHSDAITAITAADRARGLFVRAALLAALWWLISQGQWDAWLIGLPAVVLATAASLGLSGTTGPRISLRGLLDFLRLFLQESVTGGVDVARRTLAPTLRVQPGFMEYRTRLQDPLARIVLVNSISLLPGTLAADLQEDRIELHLLDVSEDPEPQLQRLERAIAAAFRLPWGPDHV
jgi:multicomponent Na+:H+ antiporter subunit E